MSKHRCHRPSPRLLADRHRRERERREDARDAQEARIYRTTDHTGRDVHMEGWSSEAIAKWKREDRAEGERKRIQSSIERCPVATTQCSQNECANGCSIVTAKPAQPTAKVSMVGRLLWLIGWRN